MEMKIQMLLYLSIVVQAGSRISRQDNGEYTVGIWETGRGQGRQQQSESKNNRGQVCFLVSGCI